MMRIEVRITIEDRDHDLTREELVDIALTSARLPELPEMAERAVERAMKALGR
jgi:hypothetical protein